ncbi:MAG: Ig-like domain-containing protein, partial [Gemmatimonadota bacterium]|nr:Ig-like domain-containing protein [Gemmatimonadota bacterium]
MIRNERGILGAVVLAMAVVFAVLTPSGGARAQEPSAGGSGVAGVPAASPAAVRPTVTMSHRWTGDAQEEFRLDITFSQRVTGFDITDIEVEGAEPADTDVTEVGSSGRRYRIMMDTEDDYDDDVTIDIARNAAENSDGEGNLAESYDFHADTRIPEAVDA